MENFLAHSSEEKSPSSNYDLSRKEKSSERILVVDDEEFVRRIFCECLSEHYICAEASSVQEAIKQLATDEYALVITDILMPGDSGIELICKLVENSPDTIVIVASGVGNAQFALNAMRNGAFDYLIKPCDLNVLELTVRRALNHRKLKLEAEYYRLNLEYQNAELARQKSELGQLQAQLVHSEKMSSLGQLVAGIAHEINNPVSFVYGNLNVFKLYLEQLSLLLRCYDEAGLPPEIAAKINNIKRQIDYEGLFKNLRSMAEDCCDGARRISEIVQNLRAFSRLDTPELVKVNINEALDSTAQLISNLYSSDNIRLIKKYGNLPEIDACPGQINQVWMNLLLNAAQAIGKAGGEVKITTYAQGESVFIEVRDSGGGIAPEDVDRIFEPFFTTKPIGEGTGLGLSISYGLIQRHRGAIVVKDANPGKTTFKVRLPIRAPESEQ